MDAWIRWDHQQRERTLARERKRRRSTAEYKVEAAERLEESGKSLQQVADELGLHANQLRGWRHKQLAADWPRPWQAGGQGG